MKFKIPFTFWTIEKLKDKSKFLLPRIKPNKKSLLSDYFKNSGIEITREEYLAIVYFEFIINFILLFVISTTILGFLSIDFFYLFGAALSFVFSMFILFSQKIYPKIYSTRRQRNIEKNLLSACQDMLIQLSSGIPLFGVLVNISGADYGELSSEFKKAVKRINAGEAEDEVLEDIAKKNPSLLFRRTLWQISNGMKTGSDMAIVVKDSMQALGEEQLIQIQDYGNKLNPLIMFYMLVSVIIPALSITFLTILSSMLNIEKTTAMLMFIGLFIFVALVQIIFLGVIKSKRPSLL